jgi:hypothetical protein
MFMKRLVVSLAAAFVVSVGLPLAPTSIGIGATRVLAADAEPETIIRGIYEAYGPDSYPDNAYDKYFSPTLLKLWDEVQAGAADSIEYAVDFDIFIDAQDFDKVTDISTSLKEDGPDKATVDVSFTSFGDQHSIRYFMEKTAAGWKIDNLDWGPDRPNLREMLEELKKGQASR